MLISLTANAAKILPLVIIKKKRYFIFSYFGFVFNIEIGKAGYEM